MGKKPSKIDDSETKQWRELVGHRIEFHRNGLAVLPEGNEDHPGVAYQVGDPHSIQSTRYCTCPGYRKKTCAHLLHLTEIERRLPPGNGLSHFWTKFESSSWYSLAALLADNARLPLEVIRIRRDDQCTPLIVWIMGSTGNPIFSAPEEGPSFIRFMERIGKPTTGKAAIQRATVLKNLAKLTLSENERVMQERGFSTRRQTLEHSFWFRMAYHGFMEYGDEGYRIGIGVDDPSGNVTLPVYSTAGQLQFTIHPARQHIAPVLEWLKKYFPAEVAFPADPLQMIYRVGLNNEKDLELITYYRMTSKKGTPVYYRKEELSRFQYGDLFYLTDQRLFARVAPPDPLAPRITSDEKMTVKRARVPAFLDQFGHVFRREPYELDAALQRLRIFKSFESVTINPEVLRRDWCWLSVQYRFGESALSLRELLKAKQEGRRFLETPEGWVDVEAEPLEGLNGIRNLSVETRFDQNPDAIRFRRMDLFRVQATTETPFRISGENERVGLLKQILKMKPASALPRMEGFTSTLRNYQKIGVEWLWFLYENGFGGLLCDDMGLGKTHQAMALMTCLKAVDSDVKRFLVVCPTTVLSHWEQKIKAFAPGLAAIVHHGSGRDLAGALNGNDVLLTSYGILRRDIDALSEQVFHLAVFDEIQNVKNTATQAYAAAKRIQAEMKLGMTGTPIENTLVELKALMDITSPSYLGGDTEFRDRYVSALKNDDIVKPRKQELSRLISPFTLRRKKASVLHDLPEKIEDIRTCRLSEAQAKLYREAIELRAEGLLTALKNKNAVVPYIHIFALLTLLKQICDHPALIQTSIERYAEYASGKWELFKELLSESLDSGQKVVVYTQFIGMVKIMEQFLSEKAIGYVTLTGASRKRGEIIRRFNEDPDCRVYVGSLKAGGTGVDLVGGSVVIHYDRWWNAAKEDQATDRVHRIGQTRGVQVFKLVTEGTLEEKISAIILAKRDLMDSIVKEDDPGLLKTFSREELMTMLKLPEGDLMQEEEEFK